MKKFSIPVTWSVWDKIEVEAETIEDAIRYVKEHIDEIPLGTELEYIDGTYRIDDGDNGENSVEDTVNYLKECCKYGGSVMPEGVEFPFPSLLFYEGRTYGQPEVVRISLPQVATGLRLRLPGSFRRRGFQPDLLMPQEALFARGAHSMQAVMHRALLRRGCSGRYHFLLGKTLPAGNQSRIRQNGGNGAWRFFIIQ